MSAEVFWNFAPYDIINDENKELLELVFKWELYLAFIENYSRIVLLNKYLKINEEVENIILN